jgi:hypothetical protein
MHLQFDRGVDGQYALLFVAHAVIENAMAATEAVRQSLPTFSSVPSTILDNELLNVQELSGNFLAYTRNLGERMVRNSAASTADRLVSTFQSCVESLPASASLESTCLNATAAAIEITPPSEEAAQAVLQGTLSSLLVGALFRELPSVGSLAGAATNGLAFFTAQQALEAAAQGVIDMQISNLEALGGGLEALAQLPIPRPVEFTLENDVAVASLSAPVVGYGAAASDAATSRSSGMSSCPLEGYPRYTPSVPVMAADYLGTLGPPFVRANERPQLWQPYPFSALNVIIDREDFTQLAPVRDALSPVHMHTSCTRHAHAQHGQRQHHVHVRRHTPAQCASNLVSAIPPFCRACAVAATWAMACSHLSRNS